MWLSICTETFSCISTRANSSAVSLPGLFSRWFGTTSLPMSCISAANRSRSSRAGMKSQLLADVPRVVATRSA